MVDQGHTAENDAASELARHRFLTEPVVRPRASDDREFCDYVEGPTQARCHKPPNHDGPHNGWAHYPGQLVSWDTSVIPPGSGEGGAS